MEKIDERTGDPSPRPKPRRTRREWAYVSLLALVGLLIGGVAADDFNPRGGPGCNHDVILNGGRSFYSPIDTHRRVAHGKRLPGRGFITSCASPTGTFAHPIVYPIKGVSVRKAVAVHGYPTTRWVRTAPPPNS
jgi:hypothetical protein